MSTNDDGIPDATGPTSASGAVRIDINFLRSYPALQSKSDDQLGQIVAKLKVELIETDADLNGVSRDSLSSKLPALALDALKPQKRGRDDDKDEPKPASAAIEEQVVELARLTEESLKGRGKVEDYVTAAGHCAGKQDVEKIWEQILELQNAANDPAYIDFPSPFVCIIDSSGSGKTQLAATTAILKPDYKVLYFYTGSAYDSETVQRFYRPYATLWRELKPCLDSLRTVLSWGVDSDLPGTTRILGQQKTHPVFRLFNKLLFGINEEATASSLRTKFKDEQPNLFVFLDEVPPKVSYLAAMMLRDCCRAIGIVPILMSTHSGAYNAVPICQDSRGADDVPELWCRVITKLPANHSYQPCGYVSKTERPLVYRIISGLSASQQNNPNECVREVRDYFRRTKPGAWLQSSVFQLCQLFRSSIDERKPLRSSHRLVGEHFGHLELDKNDINRSEAWEDMGRVRMLVADEEPILFLALTAWWESELDSVFPLMDRNNKAMSVRSVFEENRNSVNSRIDCQNPSALKLSGDHLEVVSLASVTLASLRSDEGVLGGVSLTKFIATVFRLMIPDWLTKKALKTQTTEVEERLEDLKHITCIKVPSFASADSDFPENLYDGRRGHLKRPPDNERRDGCIQVNSSDLIHIECKNYQDGLSTVTLEKIVERFRAKCKVFFVFTSNVNGVWQEETKMSDFWNALGLKVGDVGFLQLTPGEKPSWMEALNGETLEPGENCKYLVVVFAINAI